MNRRVERIAVDPSVRFKREVRSRRSGPASRAPSPPFITSTLQMAASTTLSLRYAHRTMRTGPGSSTRAWTCPARARSASSPTCVPTRRTFHERGAQQRARLQIKAATFGARPTCPTSRTSSSSSNKDGPGGARGHPADRRAARHARIDMRRRAARRTSEKLYRLIWNRFVACQMTPAKWDCHRPCCWSAATEATGAVLQDDGARARVRRLLPRHRRARRPAMSRRCRRLRRRARELAPFQRRAATRSSPARRRATPRPRSSRMLEKPKASGDRRPTPRSSR